MNYTNESEYKAIPVPTAVNVPIALLDDKGQPFITITRLDNNGNVRIEFCNEVYEGPLKFLLQ